MGIIPLIFQDNHYLPLVWPKVWNTNPRHVPREEMAFVSVCSVISSFIIAEAESLSFFSAVVPLSRFVGSEGQSLAFSSSIAANSDFTMKPFIDPVTTPNFVAGFIVTAPLLEGTYDPDAGTVTGVSALNDFSYPGDPLTQGTAELQPNASNVFEVEGSPATIGRINFGGNLQSLVMPESLYSVIGAGDTTCFWVTQANGPDFQIATMSDLKFLLRYNGGQIAYRCQNSISGLTHSNTFSPSSADIIVTKNTSTTQSVAVNGNSFSTGTGSYLSGISNGQVGGGFPASGSFLSLLIYNRELTDHEVSNMVHYIQYLLTT